MVLRQFLLGKMFYISMNMNVSQIGFSGKTTSAKKAEQPKKTNHVVANQTDVVSKDGNEALKNVALAGLNLCRTMSVHQNGSDYKIEGKYKVIGEMPTKEANAEWASRGYTDNPYKDGQTAQIIELTDKTKFVRTYDKENSGMYGSWVMKYDDIKGLSPEQIADKFALPQVPKYMCDVEFPAGTKMRTGECNPLYGWNGGGQQFDLMGARVGEFGNEREIGRGAK